MSDSIDWNLAVATASRLAPRGPELPRAQARDAVLMLRDLAAEAVEPVRRVTGLEVAGDGGAMVVDRPAWIASNVTGMRIAMGPLLDRIDGREPPAFVRDLGSRGTALQIGAVLAWLSGKVLGQYEVFTDPGERGRLLLVAPTIVHVEQQLQVPARDFRLWVCLHEETHRVQFTANPWLGDHLLAQMHAVADTIEPSALLDGLRRGAESIRSGNGSVLDLVSSPEQKEILDRVTGVMSLLEGHADVVMDGVGPSVIPSVAEIRKKFNQRRKGAGSLDKLLRRLLGLDAKMAQYRDGAVFVRHVVDKVGMEEFNAVWTGPETLPSKAEITDPDAWVARVL